MASPAPDNLSVCLVCLEELRDARVLPCLHSFCRQCLEELAVTAGETRQINCPTCRCVCQLLINGAEGLPRDCTVKLRPSKECLACKADGRAEVAKTTMVCKTCNEALCKEHAIEHVISLQDHSITALSGNVTALPSTTSPKLCADHEQPLTLFCNTCNELICGHCAAFGAHQDHKPLISTMDLVEKRKDAVRKYVHNIRGTRIQKVDSAFQRVSHVSAQLSTNAEEARRAIRTAEQRAIDTVKAHTLQLLQEVDDVEESRAKVLDEQAEELQSYKKAIVNGSEFSERLLEHEGDSEDFLSLLLATEKRTSALLETDIAEQPNHHANLEFDKVTDEELTENVGKCLGNLECHAYDASAHHSSIDESSITRYLAGDGCTVTVIFHTKDERGRPTRTGGDMVQAEFNRLPLQTTACTTVGKSFVGAPSGTSGDAAARSTPSRSISNGAMLSSQPMPGSTNTITSNEPLDESDELLFRPQPKDNYKNKLLDYIFKVHGGGQENLPRYHTEAVGNWYRGYVVALGKTFSSQPVRTAKLAQFAAARKALNYFRGELASGMAKPAQISATEQTPTTVRNGSTMSAHPSQQVKSPTRSLPPPSAAYIWDEIAALDMQYIDVHVTHINGPHDIYAHWFDCRAEYEKLEADLEERYADGRKPDVLGRSRVDGICLIEAPNKLYYRGKIQALLGSPVSKAEVFCLDHGNVETVELSSIFELPHSLYKPPFQAFLLSLNDVAAASDTPALLEEVIHLTSDKDLVAEIIRKVRGSSRLVVELWNTKEKDVSINAVLRSRFTSIHLFAPNLPDVGERSDVYISHLSKSGRELTVLMVGRGQAKLEELMEEMNKHFRKTTSAKDFLPADQLHEGKVCCARYSLDKQWYRAVILKVLPGTHEAEVRYMDYGNTEVLPTSFLRDITSVESWISKLPAQAIQCVLHDLPEDFEMSAKAKQFMDDVMADSVVLEVVKEAGKDHPALVQLFIDRNGTELNCNDEMWYLTNDESRAQMLVVEGGAVSPTEVESTNAELSADRVQQVSGTSDLAGDKDAAVDSASSEPPAVSILQPSPSPDSAAKFSAEKTTLFLSPAVDDVDNLPSLPLPEEPSDNEYGSAADRAEGNGERDACDPPQFSIVPLRPAVGTDVYSPVVFPSGEEHNPGNFVVSVGADSWSEYEVVEERMTTFYSTEVAPKPAYTWRAGHIAAAKTSIVPGVDSWVRVRVESIHGEKGRCFTLDYGNLLTVKLADLRPLQKEFCQVPSHTIRCSIHGVAPAVGKEWSTAVCTLFTETVCTTPNGNVMCGFTKIMEDVQPNEPAAHVHLIIVPESEDQPDKDINQILINAGHAVKAS